MRNELGIVKQKLGGRKTITVKGIEYDWNPVYKDYHADKTGELLKWKTVIDALENRRYCLICQGIIEFLEQCRRCPYLEKCLTQ